VVTDDSERVARSGALALLASTALSALGGVAYWLVAARELTAADVGWASSIISLLLAASTIGQANGAELLLARLPVHQRPRRLIVSSYAITAATSAVLGAVLCALGAHGLVGTDGIGWPQAIVVVVSAATWSLFTMQDAVLTALGRTAWVPFENAIYSLAKLGLLVMLVNWWGRDALLATWVLPVVPLIAAVSVGILRWTSSGSPVDPTLATPVVLTANVPRQAQRGDAVGVIVGRVGLICLPIVVVAIVGATDGGYFYVAYSMAVALYLALQAITMPVTAEGARRPDQLDRLVHSAAVRGVGLAALGLGGVVAAASLALRLYGSDYVTARNALWALTAAALPRAVLLVRWAGLRVLADDRALGVEQTATGIAMVVGAVAGAASGGITGAAVGVGIGHVLVLGPVLLRCRGRLVPSATATNARGPEALVNG
jgi:hypothetical protein